MRIIPVLDLLDGQAVHAIKGERTHYRPVQSVLCDTPDPLAVAQAFRDRLGLHDIYIADLNAIQGLERHDHRKVILNLAGREKMNIILDAGISDIEGAQKWLNCGMRKVVVGSETLRSRKVLEDMPACIQPDKLMFSLDIRSGKILSQCESLTEMAPIELLKHLRDSGWSEVILLDLSRVGSSIGSDRQLAVEALSTFPDLKFLIGGGIARSSEVYDLKASGISGVLIATALHTGIIDAECVVRLAEN